MCNARIAGDIHGHADKLKSIWTHLNRLDDFDSYLVVFLGDYVNRGPKVCENVHHLSMSLIVLVQTCIYLNAISIFYLFYVLRKEVSYDNNCQLTMMIFI